MAETTPPIGLLRPRRTGLARARRGLTAGGGREAGRPASGTPHRASRTAWRTGGGPTRELAQRAEQGHPPGPRARRAIGTRLPACVRTTEYIHTSRLTQNLRQGLTPPQRLHAPMAIRQGVEHQLGT
jgi:hypothetical protein